MATYTCISCRVSFGDGDIQRKHYKSDWHRYNLKRKIVELPPVTAEVFQEKVLAQKAEVDAKEQEKATATRCEFCSKNFSSKNAFRNHMQSKKHLEVVAKGEKVASSGKESVKRKSESEKEEKDVEMAHEDDDAEIIEDDSLEITQCLFCPHESQAFEENLKHMSRSHSFFLPDVEYITDIKGFLEYLGEKVGLGKVCLYCNEKGKNFYSVEAVQSHMVDKGHSKLDYEGDAALEYADFYDFSSSYPTDNPDNSVDNDDEVPRGTIAVDETTNELCMPSGARAGHRDLRHYYRQNLPPEREHFKIRKSIMADYKALGWHGTMGEKTKQKIKDIHMEQRQYAKHHLKLAVKANKFQKYYRPQVVF